MNKPSIIELSDTFAVVVTVCGNDETILDGLELGEDDEDSGNIICDAAINAIQQQIGSLVNLGMSYHDWHGGKFSKGMRQGIVHASFRSRTKDIDDCGEPDYSPWEWADAAAVPAELVAKVQTAMDAASEAVAVAAAAREELHRQSIEECAE